MISRKKPRWVADQSERLDGTGADDHCDRRGSQSSKSLHDVDHFVRFGIAHRHDADDRQPSQPRGRCGVVGDIERNTDH